MEILIPSLPEDLALQILAREPRQFHPVLSAVSKPIRSAVSSPHFFAVRSLLNSTETLLYLRAGSDHHTHDSWFAVYRNPNPIETESGLLRLAPVPPILLPDGTHTHAPAYAAVGPKIYALGGCTYYAGTEQYFMPQISSSVWVLDCRSHTWERGPSMRAPRYYAKTAVVNGKLYVVGGSPDNLWVEVLDPAVGLWEAVPSPLDGDASCSSSCRVVDGKISILMGEKDFRFDPATETWEILRNEENETSCLNHCEALGALFQCSRTELKRFDEKTGVWEEVKGAMEGMPKYFCEPKLVNLKGRLVMAFSEVRFGSERGSEKGKVGVWCAEIDVTQNGDGEWCGKTHWSEKFRLLPELNCAVREASFEPSTFDFSYGCDVLSVSL